MKMNLQILDCDYVMVNGKSIVRIFCKSEEGESFCVFYDKFLPYFYLDVKDVDINDAKFEVEKNGLDAEIVDRYLPVGYQPSPKKVLKITGRDPSKTPEIREWARKFGRPYEADVLFKYRYMVDHGLKGMSWINVEGNPARTTTVKCKAIEAKSITPIEVMQNAPLKYLAFDIETVPAKGGIAESNVDPISMISMVFTPVWRGKKSIVLLTKRTSAPETMSFGSESEMLKKFKEILLDYDPDILIGYNAENFDIPYILKRFEMNNIQRDLGRSEKIPFTKNLSYSQRTNICGRVVVDPYYIIKNLTIYDQPHRFKRFDLNTVSKKLLGRGKIEVGGMREMTRLWNGNTEELAKFVSYCLNDSELAMDLVIGHKLVDMDKFIEMAKLCGLLLEDLMAGQAARHESSLMHELFKRKIIMACKPDRNEMTGRASYELKGATVLEPEIGFHKDGCVLVLDFTALYPSLMMAYNICPTTLIENPGDIPHYKSPYGSCFVKETVKEGLMPYVANYLLSTRAAIRKQMKSERDENMLRILNAKQYALKGMAVSLYGYNAFSGGRMYTPDVAAAITSWGRENIEITRKLVEDNFDVKVVYGDTDSIFVKTKISDLDMAEELGNTIAKFVTSKLYGLDLKFEKLFKRFLIIAKKRYAGWSFEKVDGVWKDKIEMKGIETVRRDWCTLATKTMENVLETILKEGDISKAAKHVRIVAHDIGHNLISLEDLTIVKGVTKSLDLYDGLVPHVELAKKILQRDPSHGSVVGERLGYVIIRGNQQVSRRAEDPTYVKEKGLEVDPRYYIDNQVMPPLERIFEVCGVSPSELLEGSRQKNLGDILSSGVDTPDKTILAGFNSVVCKKCHWEFRRPPLMGICPECKSNLYFSCDGSMGKFVEFKAA